EPLLLHVERSQLRWFGHLIWMPQGPKECSSPLEYPNIRLSSRYSSRNKFSSGDKLFYNCAEGFTPFTGSRVVACKGGTWTRLTLKCERKPCGSAGEIVNGRFVYSGVEFGDTATAVCDEGYILVGEVRRNCMSNGWDGRIPVCEAVDCDDPPVVKNAEMKGPQEPPYNYRTVISYQCRVGTLIGQKEINCTKNGTWSTPPRCHGKILCPLPNVANAFWMRAQNQFFRHQDTILIECRPGYMMKGPDTITCNNDGQWIPRLPECRRRPERAAGRRLSGVLLGTWSTAKVDFSYQRKEKKSITVLHLEYSDFYTLLSDSPFLGPVSSTVELLYSNTPVSHCWNSGALT
uniref:Sushi domain-containing protein n=1 Tax=Amphiprion percula TaxID=161767 RepID=A0A3P8TJZ5_AMPPE